MNSMLNTILVVSLIDTGLYFVSGGEHDGNVVRNIILQSIVKRSPHTNHLLNVLTNRRQERQATPFVPTTSKPMPTTSMVPTPRGRCKYGNKWYNPGQEIYSGRERNWCYAAQCGYDGNIIYADDFNCFTTTTLHPTSIQNGCLYEGKWYGEGEDVYRGQSGNWCYFARCEHGNVLHADNFNCNPTTLPPTTIPPTSTPRRPGCLFEGKYYNPGTQIYNKQTGNWCYSAYCDGNGYILYGDNFNCGTHPTPGTPVNTPPLIQVG